MFISYKRYYMTADDFNFSIQVFSILLVNHYLFKVSKKEDNITSPRVSAFCLVSFFTLCVVDVEGGEQEGGEGCRVARVIVCEIHLSVSSPVN